LSLPPSWRRFPLLPHICFAARASRQANERRRPEDESDRGGKEDLYRISEELLMNVDDLLPIVEAAALLLFVKSERGDIELTPSGKRFAEADISTRKEIFREAALAHVMLLQQMKSSLASKSDHTMPLELFRDVLEEHFSDDDVQRQIDTALNWGRYGDLFTYDSESDRLVLPQS
jgi:NitT/TauT family transport system ATP-binding protein